MKSFEERVQALLDKLAQRDHVSYAEVIKQIPEAASSPEQLEGDLDRIDGRSDVYSLGATLYELLTLERPLHADSLTELIVLIKREDPAPPSRKPATNT